MRIGEVGLQPYIYNANQVSSASMNAVPPVSSNLESERTDYSGMVGAGKNENPLRPGESADFGAILDSQMALSERNANRLMGESSAFTNVIPEGLERPMANAAVESAASNAETGRRGTGAEMNTTATTAATTAADTTATTNTSTTNTASTTTTTATATVGTEQMAAENTATQPSLFQMGRAAEAYAMTMGQMAA